MIYQISAGQGPSECEYAVTKLFEEFQKDGAIKLDSSPGYNKGTYRSIRFFTENNMSDFIGSIKCVFKSPYRIGHKRKNWFIDFSECEIPKTIKLDTDSITFETFRSSGAGGQNVNKVESGVRLVYSPLNISIECTEERSQHSNKQKAIEKLKRIIDDFNKSEKDKSKNKDWAHHNYLLRGNETKVFYF